MNYPVKIVVLNSAGDMAYSVSVLHVARGDSITWSCETGPITISFRDPSPLDEGRQIRSLPGPVHTAVGTVSLRATSGVHYYAVAASMDGKVFLDPGCPEIIVDNNGPRWMASEPEAETEEAEVEEDTAKEPEFLQLLEPDEELEKVSAGAPIYKVELEEEPEELFAAAPSS